MNKAQAMRPVLMNKALVMRPVLMKKALAMSTNTMSHGLGQAEKLAVGELYSINNCYIMMWNLEIFMG